MDPALTDEQERYMHWLEDDVTGHSAGAEAPVPAEWLPMREEAAQLGDLLRAALPPDREPPAAESFNEELSRRLV